MGLKLRLTQKHQVGDLRPLCRIVNLLATRSSFDKDEVKAALEDFYDKHPDGLTWRVSEIDQNYLQTPNEAVAFWLRTVNPNAIKVASLCLEEQVSQSYPDSVNASMTTILHTLQSYQDSKHLLLQRQESVRGKLALEKANALYELIRTTFTANHSYLERVASEDSYQHIERLVTDVQETLNYIDESSK